jgi:hypothetical protein
MENIFFKLTKKITVLGDALYYYSISQGAANSELAGIMQPASHVSGTATLQWPSNFTASQLTKCKCQYVTLCVTSHTAYQHITNVSM